MGCCPHPEYESEGTALLLRCASKNARFATFSSHSLAAFLDIPFLENIVRPMPIRVYFVMIYGYFPATRTAILSQHLDSNFEGGPLHGFWAKHWAKNQRYSAGIGAAKWSASNILDPYKWRIANGKRTAQAQHKAHALLFEGFDDLRKIGAG
jgi:hypothetical protein